MYVYPLALSLLILSIDLLIKRVSATVGVWGWYPLFNLKAIISWN